MKNDTEKRQLRLMDFISKCVDTFQYTGNSNILQRREDIFEPRLSFDVDHFVLQDGEAEQSESELESR
mgnify:CR=1 FL=1